MLLEATVGHGAPISCGAYRARKLARPSAQRAIALGDGPPRHLVACEQCTSPLRFDGVLHFDQVASICRSCARAARAPSAAPPRSRGGENTRTSKKVLDTTHISKQLNSETTDEHTRTLRRRRPTALWRRVSRALTQRPFVSRLAARSCRSPPRASSRPCRIRSMKWGTVPGGPMPAPLLN